MLEYSCAAPRLLHAITFRESAEIVFGISEQGEVKLVLYDESGRRVRELTSGVRGPGVYKIRWDRKDQNGREVSGGVYFCRLETERRAVTRKLVVLR